jgi:hypothetical protein
LGEGQCLVTHRAGEVEHPTVLEVSDDGKLVFGQGAASIEEELDGQTWPVRRQMFPVLAVLAHHIGIARFTHEADPTVFGQRSRPSTVEQAGIAAGDMVVGLHGATVMQQALSLGPVDEVRVRIVRCCWAAERRCSVPWIRRSTWSASSNGRHLRPPICTTA